MSKSVYFMKEDMRKRLRQYGIRDAQVEETARLFEKGNRHLDVISFVILMERYGLARRGISDFLKDLGVDDITIINIFGKVDLKKTEFAGKDVTQVMLED